MEYHRFLNEINSVMDRIDASSVEVFLNKLTNCHRIYVIGEGRSGLVAKAFAMRLVHLRKRCYVVGEAITPALRKGDMLLAVSGSGETRSVVETAETARRLGGVVLGVMARPDSTLSKYCSDVVIIPAKIMKKSLKSFELRELEGIPLEPPLGSLFEVSTMIFFEAIVIELMKRLKIGEMQMYKVHSNL